MDLPAAAVTSPAPATRNRTWPAVVRQIWWASIPVWSVGFLSFLPFLRIAVGRRRRKDWAVFAAYAVAVAALIAVVSVRTSGTGTVAGGAFVLMLMGTAAAHTAVKFRPARGGPRRSVAGDNREAVAAARDRMRRRIEAVKLIRANPALARDLRIGRPDLPREYDDGGLVDVNHVPAHVLASHLGLRPDEVRSLVAARDKLGTFSSADELAAYAALSPDRVDELRDLMIFS
jgi:Helix-hairpin-helix motif